MAATPFFSLFTFIVSLLLFATALVLSRPLSPSHETVILDVVSSIQQTLHILSVNTTRASPTRLPGSDSDPVVLNSSLSFSLELQSREILEGSRHKDYRSLVLSRLERDSARVAAIAAKINLAVEGIDRSKLRPVDEDDTRIRSEDISGPIVSGVPQGSGEYFLRIGVGTPANEMSVAVDTASDENWVQCQPCSDCYQQSDPIFNPTSSSSYSPLSCASPLCSSLPVSACRADHCLYQVGYGDGSFTVGDFATETVSFGNSGKVNGFAIGCGHDNEGLFVASAGLFALGGGALSLTSQIKAKSFSYCLVDRDSDRSSTLEFNSAGLGDVTAPLLRNPIMETFYYVGLTGISVGGHPVAIPPSVFDINESGRGGIILDSGTAVTRLPQQAYNSLRDAFKNAATSLKSRTAASFALFDTCYDLSSLSQIEIPTVAFQFAGGKSLLLPAKNYFIPVDSGIFCFAFAPTSSALSIIGNVQQQGIRVLYDLTNNLVGFSPNKC